MVMGLWFFVSVDMDSCILSLFIPSLNVGRRSRWRERSVIIRLGGVLQVISFVIRDDGGSEESRMGTKGRPDKSRKGSMTRGTSK
jgi:hypothetical protein